jgi:hypothetical protein
VPTIDVHIIGGLERILLNHGNVKIQLVFLRKMKILIRMEFVVFKRIFSNSFCCMPKITVLQY